MSSSLHTNVENWKNRNYPYFLIVTKHLSASGLKVRILDNNCCGFRSGYSHNWKTQCKEYNKLLTVSEQNLRHASLHARTCRNRKQAMTISIQLSPKAHINIFAAITILHHSLLLFYRHNQPCGPKVYASSVMFMSRFVWHSNNVLLRVQGMMGFECKKKKKI